jgi:AmmeMemoRadiSam system protein A
MTFTTEDKKVLLSLARESIFNNVAPGKNLSSPVARPGEALQMNCGAFVSLYVEGKLRGCIGTFSEEYTLINMAVSAAISDNRFNPIEPGDLELLKIEISVLSPRERIYKTEEIILGKHGIYMVKGMNRGTLLPQVAISQNWNVKEFLGNCAKYKAGIGWDGWKSADLYIYEAYVFNSEETGFNC